jgi:enamine deaminase RidA (YjgF/YER057c/UK114 family)
VHTAGACPIDEHDRVIALGDIAGQARQVMDNLEVALLVTAWSVIRARFGDHDAPSTLLGVTTLGYKGQLVEVDAVAVAK